MNYQEEPKIAKTESTAALGRVRQELEDLQDACVRISVTSPE